MSDSSPAVAAPLTLLPCPFCGGPARCFVKYPSNPSLGYRVMCDAAGDDVCGIEPHEDFVTEAGAVAAWNRRK